MRIQWTFTTEFDDEVFRTFSEEEVSLRHPYEVNMNARML